MVKNIIKIKKKPVALLMAAMMTISSVNLCQTTEKRTYVTGEKSCQAAAYSTGQQLQPEMSSNIDAQNYSMYADVINSYLVPEETGYMRVEFIRKAAKTTEAGNSEQTIIKELVTERYDDTYRLLTRQVIDSSADLEYFAGFYAGSDANYVVWMQEVPAEDDNGNDIWDETKEFLRVVKYDKNWNRLDSVSMNSKNCNLMSGENGVVRPTDGGCMRMTEYQGHLYMQSSYLRQDGHQQNIMFDVLESDMSLAGTAYQLVNYYYAYVSHSFNQYLLVDDSLEIPRMVTLNHGDAFPARGAVLGQYVLCTDYSKVIPEYNSMKREINAFGFAGADGLNYTGASLGGFEASGTHYLVAGNSVDQSAAFSSTRQRNIFISAIPKSEDSGNVGAIHWLTDYDEEDDITVSTPQMTKMGNDLFLVMWNIADVSHCDGRIDVPVSVGNSPGIIRYRFVDGSGTPVSDVYETTAEMSDCKPVVKGDKAVWYSSGAEGVKFYSIDKNGTFSMKSVNGLETPVLKEPVQVSNGIYLEWEKIEGASGYTVCKKYMDGTGTVQYWYVDGAVSNYTDEERYFDGNAYEYWVYAYNDSVQSYVSNHQSGNIFRGVRVLNTENVASGVSVSWDAYEGADGYELYRSLTGDTAEVKKLVSLQGTDTKYIDNETESGIGYDYYIRTIKGEQISPLSLPKTVYYLEKPELRISYNGIYFSLSWDEVAGAEKYMLTRWDIRTGEKQVTTCTSALDDYTDYNTVVDGNCYKFQVYAFSTKNGGTQSAIEEKEVTYVKPTPTPSPVPTATPERTPTPTPNPVPTATPERTPSPSPVPTATPERTPTPSPLPTVTPERTPTPSQVSTAMPERTPTPSPVPTVTPERTPSPSPVPTPSPVPLTSKTPVSKLPATVITSLKCVPEGVEVQWEPVEGAAIYHVYTYNINDPYIHSYCGKTIGRENTGLIARYKSLEDGDVQCYYVRAYRADEDMESCSDSEIKSICIQIPEATPEPTPTPVLPAPVITNIEAFERMGWYGLRITWSPVEGADGYYINIRDEASVTALRGQDLNGDEISWEDTRPEEGKKYYYSIFAYIMEGNVMKSGAHSEEKGVIFHKPAASEKPEESPQPGESETPTDIPQKPASSQLPESPQPGESKPPQEGVLPGVGDYVPGVVVSGRDNPTLDDALIVLKLALKIVKKETLNKTQLLAADVVGDREGEINLDDATAVLKKALKIPIVFKQDLTKNKKREPFDDFVHHINT